MNNRGLIIAALLLGTALLTASALTATAMRDLAASLRILPPQKTVFSIEPKGRKNDFPLPNLPRLLNEQDRQAICKEWEEKVLGLKLRKFDVSGKLLPPQEWDIVGKAEVKSVVFRDGILMVKGALLFPDKEPYTGEFDFHWDGFGGFLCYRVELEENNRGEKFDSAPFLSMRLLNYLAP